MLARSSSVIHDRWRNSINGTSGASSSATSRSSSSASGDFFTRGWYCSSTPRNFPDASSGASDSRNSANARSRESVSSCPVISFDAFAWKTNSEGVRSAQRAAVSGDGRR